MEWTKVVDWTGGRQMNKLEMCFGDRIGRMLGESEVKGMNTQK